MVDTKHNRRAVLLSTEVDVDARTIDRSDQARVHMECLCRDATQWTGWCDSQARAQANRDVPVNARVTAVPLATREAREPHGAAVSSLAMTSLKRRAVNHQLLDPMCEPFAKGPSLEKSSPADEELCHDGRITE